MGPILICFAIISLVTAAEASYCKITKQVNSCEYTIVCSSKASSVSIPSCRTNNNVEFIVMDSNLPILTIGFFSSTNFDSKVRRISAVNNSWTNIETRAFTYYKEANFIDISKNNIQYVKSLAFKGLVKLDTLNISSNNLETLDPTTFYSDDGVALDLRILDLSYNKLNRLSTELSKLKKLEQLFLQNNLLHNLESNSFSDLKSLQILNIQHNLLNTLNNSLSNVKSLSEFYINDNQLTWLFNDTCGQSNLKILNASHNFIRAIQSDCFYSSLNLSVIDFSFNNITSSLSNKMFENNRNLRYVDFYNNHIEVLGTNVFANNSPITYIDLDKNNLTSVLTAETFVGLKNITTLQITNQSISIIKEMAFAGLNKLQYLNLTRNQISVIANSSFVNTSIVKLDVSYNQISTLGFCKDLLTLTELYLNNNNISIVPRLTFFGMNKLKVLDLSMNMIITFEELSLPLVELQYLNITGNRLSGTIQKNIFSPAKMLRLLDISNFNISKIDPMAFANLPNLARLNLSHNQIDFIDPNNFVGVNNMYSLDVSYNRLKQLVFNGNILSNLKAIYLNNNELTNISSIFSNSSKLLYLDLSHNNIRNVSGVGSNMFPNITVLRLSYNNIENFNNPQTNSLTSLVDLDLSSNNISDIKLKYYKDLMTLALSGNKLSRINSTFFENVDYIQALDLSHNNISALPPGTFQNMRNLKLLNLSSNYLSQLRYGSLKGLHKTELLDISRNNLRYIEVDVFHECVKLNTLILDYNFLTTLDVVTLTHHYLFNLKTLSIGGNPISCREVVLSSKSVRFNQVEVTAIDKIYHEDNVHGIKCGNGTSSTEEDEPEEKPSSDVTTVVMLILSAITIFILILVVFKLFRSNGFLNINGRTLSSSLEMDSTNVSQRSLI